VNVLEAVRHTPSVRAVINVTTDKCYENPGSQRALVEGDALGGSDPYSASKACAEIVSASYRCSFLAQRQEGPVALATARAGNVIGGGDWSMDRIVPDMVRAAVTGQPVAIRNPNATRPWQHVLEPLAGYLLLGQRLWERPEAHARAWNFGPDDQAHLSVGALAEIFAQHWPQLRCAIDPGQHPHEAQWLHLDSTLARSTLGWRPVWTIEQTLARTALWYRQWAQDDSLNTLDDLRTYVQDARQAKLEWAA
jgi:CDP-glucose 4,6-dehydratase